MTTNHLMLRELREKYHPEERGFVSQQEADMIRETLCLEEMDILALRNLRDFVVVIMGRSESMEDWDRMSAITFIIDMQIIELGGEV